jgi:hypothetical protein
MKESLDDSNSADLLDVVPHRVLFNSLFKSGKVENDVREMVWCSLL